MIFAGLLTNESKSGSNAGARISLLTKGIAAFVILVLYIVLIGVMVAEQRDALRATVERQRSVFAMEEALARVNSTLAYAILNVHEAYSNPASRVRAETIVLDIEALQAGLQGIEERYRAARPWISRLERNVAGVRSEWGGASLVELRESLHELVAQLDAVTGEVRDYRHTLSEDFRVVYDSITLTSLVMGLLGVVIFGSVVMLFFSHMVRDIRRLQARAMEVVTGYRGTPIEVTRHDELGALMQSVNRMQSELRERERQLEIARQQRFYHEKMAAIGALAAEIAHEVNNPIAAITGIAEAIHDTRRSSACPQGGCRPDLILEHTRRIGHITRQLAEMTTPHSPEPQLLDLNALVRNTSGFVRYDARFRNVEFRLDLDPDVPAVTAIADHLTQVLMNLLINAADATTGIADRTPVITVETGCDEAEIQLVIADNGCGMEAQTLTRAFDDGFTTKPPGKGSGLGLFMCRSLIEAAGGRIELDSTKGSGTRVTIRLPRPTAQG